MLTQTQVLEEIQHGKKSATLDGSDFARLSDFFAPAQWGVLGFVAKEGVNMASPARNEWAYDTIIEALKDDVAFGFEKALNKRGISASLMNDCVKMWLWILEDPLQYHTEYAQYGLPLLKEVAVKYNFVNPIGNDSGNEFKYSADSD